MKLTTTHALIMRMNTLEAKVKELEKILSNERKSVRKHEQNEKLCSNCKYGTLLKSEFPCNICNKALNEWEAK